MDGKQRDLGGAGRGHGDVVLHRPQSRAAARGRPRFAWIGGKMLPALAGKEPDRSDLERPDMGQGTQGLDIHYVASSGARNAPPTALPLDRSARHAAAELTAARSDAGLVRDRRVGEFAETDRHLT